MEKGIDYCSKCGSQIGRDEKYCSKCGQSRDGRSTGTTSSGPQLVVNVQKDPGVAAVLGIVLGMIGIFGIGQIYTERFLRGIGFLFLGWVFIALIMMVGFTVALTMESMILAMLAFLLPVIFYIWQAYDAYKLAKRFNEVIIQTGKAPW